MKATFLKLKTTVHVFYKKKFIKNETEMWPKTKNSESVTHFSQFVSVKVKKLLRKSQAQFREKVKKLRLSQNDDFLVKKTCIIQKLCFSKLVLYVMDHFLLPFL